MDRAPSGVIKHRVGDHLTGLAGSAVVLEYREQVDTEILADLDRAGTENERPVLLTRQDGHGDDRSVNARVVAVVERRSAEGVCRGLRPEERRVGKGGVSTCRYRGWADR